MPIYEYRRLTDGEVIEVIQKPGEAPLEKCPETGAPVEKLISRSAFQLKGAGWYVNDYKSKPNESAITPKKENAESSQDSSASASQSSSETKPESVSETKTESSSPKSSSEASTTVKKEK